MKIESIRSEQGDNRHRVAATVTWEDCNRPKQDLYFETDNEFAHSLTSDPHAFLLACAIPAMHYREKRVSIDAKICPELQDGLQVAMGWLRHWFDPDLELPRIEAQKKSTVEKPRAKERAGFFFSGGIDSFATLARNRLNFPSDHPRAIKDGLLVYGLEQDIPEIFEYVKNSLSAAAQDVGITLIPVYTNLYLPYRQEDSGNHWEFWWGKFMGAALAAVAHAFSQRLTEVSISPDYDIPNQVPHGSHPLVDPNYSSVGLRIRHDGVAFSRFAKTKMVADWGVPLQHLRVCNKYQLYKPGEFNCGKCEKCIRTMLALLALGRLAKTQSFPEHKVSEELVSKIKLEQSSIHFYDELITPLEEKGRNDLVRVITKKIHEYHKRQKLNYWKSKTKKLLSIAH